VNDVSLRTDGTPDAANGPDEGRSRDRYRRIALTGGTSVVSRVLGVLGSLVTVPVTLHYLGPDRYGLWMTITSMTVLVSFADLGIANGVVTLLSSAIGRDDEDESRRVVTGSVTALIGAMCVSALVAAVAYPLVPWSRVYNVTSAAGIREAGPATLALLVVYIIGIPVSLVRKVRVALQEGYIDNWWSIGGSAVSIAAVLGVVAAQRGLVELILATAGVQLFALIANGVQLLAVQHPELRPRFDEEVRPIVTVILKTGAYFLFLQLCGALAYESNSLIVAQVRGSASVVDYALPMKLFMMVPLALGYIFTPMWPAFAEARSREDTGWVRTAFVRAEGLGLLLGIPCVTALAFAAQWLLTMWLHATVIVSTEYLVALSLWVLLTLLNGPMAMLLNGYGRLRFQAVVSGLMVVANVGLSIWLTISIGVSGVVWGSVISQGVFIVVPSLIYVWLMLGGSRRARVG
jgi:O-antigen/teichoic acid export membrane protein